ncbi:MAG: hypothetical protein CVU63_25535 [Deltaproteobacteria bacterium HGW-Deltaproteobacteria-20]|nr:MAG: hypothetical protein CVU63_25535 [Deltaproteobacteria bacterium HGW-Deltaproteobacteria-20]
MVIGTSWSKGRLPVREVGEVVQFTVSSAWFPEIGAEGGLGWPCEIRLDRSAPCCELLGFLTLLR